MSAGNLVHLEACHAWSGNRWRLVPYESLVVGSSIEIRDSAQFIRSPAVRFLSRRSFLRNEKIVGTIVTDPTNFDGDLFSKVLCRWRKVAIFQPD